MNASKIKFFVGRLTLFLITKIMDIFFSKLVLLCPFS